MNKGFYFLGIFTLFASYFLFDEIEIFDVIELDGSKGEKCLDGSNYQFYVNKGYGEGVNNFILFFDGGGWCSSKVYNSTLASCSERSQTYLGSSLATMNQRISSIFGKIIFIKRLMIFITNDKTINPKFYNWNKIFLNYCDGRGFVGFNNDPIKHEGKDLYFRGFNNTLGVLDYIKQNMNFNQTENVIISGVSAGGLASLHYSNFISDYFPNNTKVKTVSDSGFFLDIVNKDRPDYNFGIIWKDLIKFTNPSLFPDIKADCKEKETWKCFIGEYFINNIKIPVFIVHSLYDGYTLCHLIGECSLTFVGDLLGHGNGFNMTQPIYEENRKRLIEQFTKIRMDKPNWGIFSPACHIHDYIAYSNSWDEVMVNSKNLKKVVSDWIETGKEQFYVDDKPWPSNQSCMDTKDVFYFIEYLGLLTNIF